MCLASGSKMGEIISEASSVAGNSVAIIPFKGVKRTVECVGPAYIKYYMKRYHGQDGRVVNKKTSEKVVNTVFEDDVEYLRSLDPKEWKEQDHYAVLGIKDLRFKATEEDVKRAYRQKVLRHHPDKRKAQGEEIRNDDDYFTCITKAYEILGTPLKRRSYDSVDPEFDDSLPTSSEIKKDFYKCFDKYFQLNSRWTDKRNVPQLGDEGTARNLVEKFYSFWYDFESWREYSYNDEEEKEKGQDREERRWIEKQNKTVRAKRKKEEMTRIRTLVDLAYNADPRIVKFKQDDKDKKLAAKKARQDAALARKAEEDRIMKEAQRAKEVADQEEKARADTIRAEKELQKKHMKKERKTFRDLCKSNNYFITEDSETIDHMSAVEKICEIMKFLELQDLNKQLAAGGRDCFIKIKNETEEKLEAERKALFDNQKSDSSKQNAKSSTTGPPTWTTDHVQTLIKSVNFFPAGTNQRWEVIANFVNQHGTFEDHRRFTAKDILSKAKDLQNTDFSKSLLKVAANQEAFDKFEKEKKKPVVSTVDDTGISKSFDVKKPLVNGNHVPEKKERTPKLDNGDAESSKRQSVEKQERKSVEKQERKSVEKQEEKKDKEEVPWSKTEQELLEQAIKTYPASTSERWERIAECIPNRSKKDCMKRFKELVDLVKAKKAAQMVK